MKPLKSLRTTDSDNPGWLRRLVRPSDDDPKLGTEELNAIIEKTKCDLIFMGCPKTETDYRNAIMMAIMVGQVDEANAAKMRTDKPINMALMPNIRS
jgi:coenzyme F420-reducing hydrogenase gamma subunit